MPIKSLEEMKAALKDVEKSEDILSFHVEAVEAEKNRGISEKRRANEEAKGLRAYKKALEGIGYNNKLDLDEFMEALEEKLEAAENVDPQKTSETEKELKKLRRDFEKQQKTLEEERERAQKIKTESDRRTLSSKITEAIKEKVYGADLVAENLIANGRVVLEDNGDISWIDGDDTKSFDDGIKAYIESRPDIVRNNQRGGAGSPPGSRASNKKYDFDKVSSMSKEDIRANLDEIKASFNLK